MMTQCSVNGGHDGDHNYEDHFSPAPGEIAAVMSTTKYEVYADLMSSYSKLDISKLDRVRIIFSPSMLVLERIHRKRDHNRVQWG